MSYHITSEWAVHRNDSVSLKEASEEFEFPAFPDGSEENVTAVTCRPTLLGQRASNF